MLKYNKLVKLYNKLIKICIDEFHNNSNLQSTLFYLLLDNLYITDYDELSYSHAKIINNENTMICKIKLILSSLSSFYNITEYEKEFTKIIDNTCNNISTCNNICNNKDNDEYLIEDLFNVDSNF